MKVLNVVGARPNFMKAAPLVKELSRRGHQALLIHTGQHYDENMSKVFFQDLEMPEPDAYLGVGSGTHAEQTARVMTAFEKVLEKEKPDLVVVVGDVNSTLACALVCAKLLVPVAHVEAGLRSRDRTMPEEINRLVTDVLSDLLFTHCEEAGGNLRSEGIPAEKIHFVGNIMIDSLAANLERAKDSDILSRLTLAPRKFGVVTLHRPSNVDDPAVLEGLMGALRRVAARVPLVFSCHPRTAKRLAENKAAGISGDDGALAILPPLGYLDFLHLLSQSRLVLTDSGGLQEETTWLGIPCVTIRKNTERPVTLSLGTNRLAGTDPARVEELALQALREGVTKKEPPPLWDGKTAHRIVDVVEDWGRA